MMIRNPPMQPPWMQPQQPQQQPNIPMFSQGQGMPGMQPPMQPPTSAMGGPPQQQQGVNPATVQAMMSLRQQQPQMEEIARQRQLADMLRQQAQGQLKGVQVGRSYAGPNLGNLGANLLNQYMGARTDEDAAAKAQGLAESEGETAQDWFDQLTGKTTGRRPPRNPYASAGGGGAGIVDMIKGLFGGGAAG